ncbi:MAG: TIGR04282 family arsenosugar biosynthesis glycosyltransferase [Arenicellaceae bacterium]|nr:TIGR04282 family arsenosugar biosynthesis glycosyltransferase [Arenicellaceae bacterium]
MPRCIQIFAKAPIPGKVKTRMQPELDDEQCAELAKRLLHHSCQLAKEYRNGEIQLWCSPDTGHPYFFALAEKFPLTLFAQRGEHLGQRMINAMNNALDSGFQPLLIGADCPFFDNQYLDNAFKQLEQHDVVLGPATDGGYVLIGSNQILPKDILDEIAWGTANAMQQTIEQVSQRGLKCGLLEPLADIDRVQDLELLNPIGLLTSGVH